MNQLIAEDGTVKEGFVERGLVFVIIVLPFVGLIYVTVMTYKNGVSIFYPFLAVMMYILTGLGITIGFHRLFTHESFKTYKSVKLLFAILGTMAVQGRLIIWCARHHMHHQNSDNEGDPHSPWRYGTTPWAIFRGFWWAHIGWIFSAKRPVKNSCQTRLANDFVTNIIDRTAILWVFVSMGIPMLAGYVYEHSSHGVWQGFLWGFLVRLFVVQHFTWSINSWCHIWGKRNFNTKDNSKDSLLWTVCGLGEGAHNSHHAFPRSPQHAILHEWLDISYLVIKLLQKLNLVWDLKTPTSEEIRQARVK
ncbi:acyl-CoA desaturase [Candidatus Nomurabacteria bacterium]|nr:acyl-CoA desaturase [Candidatus Nomurabacteria bacterium]